MNKFLSILPRWIPALLMMGVIFIFSSRTGDELPNFLGWDYVVKKTSHMVGYALLALAFHYAFRFSPKYRGLGWLLAILYAATDEFHQSSVQGRHASIYDVLVFDNIGALAILYLEALWRKREPRLH